MRIAIIFSNELRPETTGYYCRRALSTLADVEHLWPEELAYISADMFDFYFLVDDGLDYPIPAHLRPRSSWAIDTHVNFDRVLRRFGDSELLFAAQKNGAAAIERALKRRVVWLPLACDPEVHRPELLDKKHDLGFVGHFIGTRRCNLLDMLAKQFPSSRFCQTSLREMSQIYSASRVGFNCSIADDINMRVFEVLAHGIPLLTNNIESNGLEELFEIGTQLLTFDDDTTAVSIASRLLENPAEREQIGRCGREHVLSHHTYRHRMLRVLDLMRSFGRSKTFNTSNEKSPHYFEFSRPDVRELVPAGASRVLDIGCGGGRLGYELLQNGVQSVVGIEHNLRAAQAARSRLTEVHQTSIQSAPNELFNQGIFDTIIFADVLEHLRDPMAAIRKASYWLASDGQLIISVPNSRHHSVVSGLISGNWTYESAGLLDDDHVRCFTRREIEKLLYRAGFAINAMISIPGSGYDNWIHSGKPVRIGFDNFQICGTSVDDVEEFFVYQYVLRANRRTVASRGLTSIVIVAWNQLSFTRECVESVQRRTDVPFEFVFVDNGSTDGTEEYLSTIADSTVVRNEENRGFAPAVNQALSRCRGEHIVLLNNDCVVTTGWLDRLLDVLWDDEQNGIVGPLSNNVSGPQQIPVSYSDLTGLDGFAWDMRDSRTAIETDRLVGFCMLFRRQLIEVLGGLDERFEIGCFEDDDFCKRAKDAGYRLLIATNSFVHHYGSQTFKAAGIDFDMVMSVNRAKYEEKWSTPKIARSSTPLSAEERSELYEPLRGSLSDSRILRKTKRLSLCMIVRNNEATIDECLSSIYPWVDEIVIVDTGSNDRTVELCSAYTAQVFHFPWCDDFSAARNESLSHASGDWIFWMDSDDIIPQAQGQRLRALTYGRHHAGIEGYVMQVQCPSETEGSMTFVDHVKLFRNRPEFRFEHRIHEQILPSIRRFGGEIDFTDIYVIHAGSRQDPETRQRKLERDFRILELERQLHPDHPFVLFNLGMTHEDAGNYTVAADYLRRSIELAHPTESHLRKAWALLVNCQRLCGNVSDAGTTCCKALELYPDDPELLFRYAAILQELQNHQAAIIAYKQLLSANEARIFRSIDPGIRSYKARHNLALSLSRLNRSEDAIEQWRLAVSEKRDFATGWESLGRELIAANDRVALGDLLRDIDEVKDLQGTGTLLRALAAEADNDFDSAIRELKEYTCTTRCEVCLDELCRIQTTHGLHADAVQSLERLLELKPQCAATHHNLGVALSHIGQILRSISALQMSLELDPNRLATGLYLAELMANQGKIDEAMQTLCDCLTHHPNNERIIGSLSQLRKLARGK